MMTHTLFRKWRSLRMMLPATLALLLAACSVDTGPKAVVLGSDQCDGCGMTIEDAKFACEFVSDKGRCMKFDDLSCLFHYLHKQHVSDSTVAKIYVADYTRPDSMLDITTASLVLGSEIHSPMNGGVAAFHDAKTATTFARKTKSILLDSWQRLKVQH